MKLLKRLRYGINFVLDYANFYFGKNWWAMLHIAHEESAQTWFTGRLRSLFGVPLSTFFFRVAGPFGSQAEAEAWIATRLASRQPCRLVPAKSRPNQ